MVPEELVDEATGTGTTDPMSLAKYRTAWAVPGPVSGGLDGDAVAGGTQEATGVYFVPFSHLHSLRLD